MTPARSWCGAHHWLRHYRRFQAGETHRPYRATTLSAHFEPHSIYTTLRSAFSCRATGCALCPLPQPRRSRRQYGRSLFRQPNDYISGYRQSVIKEARHRADNGVYVLGYALITTLLRAAGLLASVCRFEHRDGHDFARPVFDMLANDCGGCCSFSHANYEKKISTCDVYNFGL
jgi:hypothetical protein